MQEVDIKNILLTPRFSHEGVEFNYIEFDEVLRKYANDNFYNKI